MLLCIGLQFAFQWNEYFGRSQNQKQTDNKEEELPPLEEDGDPCL